MEPIDITQGEVPWNPKDPCHSMDETDRFKQEVIAIVKADEEEEQENPNFTFYTNVDPAFIEEEKTYDCVTINADATINHLEEIIADEELKLDLVERPQSHKAIPGKIDCDQLALYFLFRPKKVIRKTIKTPLKWLNQLFICL